MQLTFKILIGAGLLYLIICFLFYWFQEKLLFIPQKLPSTYQFHFSTPFEEIYLKTNESEGEVENSINIHGVHFYAPEPKGVILYFHGNAGSLVGWGAEAEKFVDLGYDVFVMDFRGYGKSGGKPSFKTVLSDAELCYNHILTNYSADKIILYGRSLGTGFASYVASRHSVSKLILETPYYSIGDVAGTYFPFLPVKLINRYPINSYCYLQNVKIPIYIFHGTADQVVPYKSGKKLLASIEDDHVKFITIDKGAHNDLADYPLYWEEMTKILN